MGDCRVVNLLWPSPGFRAKQILAALRSAGIAPHEPCTRAVVRKYIGLCAPRDRRNRRVAELPPTLRLDRPSHLALRRRLQIVEVVLGSFFVSGLVALSVLSSYEEN